MFFFFQKGILFFKMLVKKKNSMTARILLNSIRNTTKHMKRNGFEETVHRLLVYMRIYDTQGYLKL